MAAVAWWCFFYYTLELFAPSFDLSFLWLRVKHIGVVAIPVLWFEVALRRTGQVRLVTSADMLLFSVIPVATLVLVWTGNVHRLYWII